MAGQTTDSLVASALRRAGLPARAMDLAKTRFPQPRRNSSFTGKTIAVSRNLTSLETLVAQALPGARRTLTVGRMEKVPQGQFLCGIEKNRLIARVYSPDTKKVSSLSCLPPKKSLRNGARVPAWWFSAYEELGGGSPWHDGFDDNGTYYWTIERLQKQGTAVKVVPMGFSKNRAADFGEHPLRQPLRELLESCGLLDISALPIYWKLLPCETGRSVVIASLHLPTGPDELKTCLDSIATVLAGAKRRFDKSRDFVAVWKYTCLDRAVLY